MILAGVVKDANGNLWNLPAVVTIPPAGTVAVTVTAQQPGAISAPAGSINTLYNPQQGWQSFTSTADAAVGGAVEQDSILRSRQSISTATPAQDTIYSIIAAVGNVTGVTRYKLYENDTGITDANGIPAHSISLVVYGGAIAYIAAAIDSRKPPGTPTYGSTSQVVYDALGLATTINFFTLQLVPIYVDISIQALTGFVTTTEAAIQTAVANFINSLAIGGDVYAAQTQAIASLMSVGLGQTFTITAFTLGTAPAPTGTSDLTIAFNQAAVCTAADVTITVA